MQNKRSNPSRRGRASDYQDRSSSGSNESNGYVRRDPFDPSAYSRKSAFSRDEYTRESSTARRVAQRDYAKERVRRKRKKTIAVAIAVVAVLCLGGAAAAYAYYHVLDSNLHEGVTEELRGKLVETDLAKEPFYMLLMGTDGSNDREASEEFAGDQFRSDSIMLARIDPVDKKVTLVSLHRDTLVDMGEEYGQNKLNAAHALGGAALSVEVVSELAGVPISHYAEINFDGFKDIVDALGGVEVDVPMEIDDADAGGYLAAGPQTLNGDQALILCRARHAYDEYGPGDAYRAANQRLVLAAIAKKILSADIGTMASTVTALTNYVTTDLAITDIVGLAQAMQGLDPATDIYSAMEPTTSEYIDDVWYEITDTPAWKEMMRRVDQGLPPTEEAIVDEATGTVLATAGGARGSSSGSDAGATPKRTGTVAVRNGNGLDGAGTQAATRIETLGYTVDSGNADSFDYPQTIVVYDSSDKAAAAQEIADALGVGVAQVNDGSYSFEEDFLVVLGADWQ